MRSSAGNEASLSAAMPVHARNAPVFGPSLAGSAHKGRKKGQLEGWPREFVFPRVVTTNLREISLYRGAIEPIARKELSLGLDSLFAKAASGDALTLRCSCEDESTHLLSYAPCPCRPLTYRPSANA